MVCCGYTCIGLWIVGGLLVALKLYNKLTAGVYKGKEKLHGKTVIVTGSNAGIGLECAKDFAQRGARVIMVCRDMKKAERVKTQIINETGNSNIVLKHIDFASLDTVRTCAKEILAEESKIDILLNNAGCVAAGRKLTPDGLDVLMQSNHFGPFLFTNILLDKIKKSAPSRIVNVSSHGHKYGIINFDNFKTVKDLSDFKAYCVSKLANVYFTEELAKKLKGTGVTVNSLHPGVFVSEISRDSGFLIKNVWSSIVKIFFKNLKEGAQTSIYLCLSPDVANVTGEYFSDCQIYETTPAVKDMGIAKKVWEISEDALKHIDFTSFDTVRECAKEILAEENKIHILLNNAGAGTSLNLKCTSDGLDAIMQSNHFGPFLFTNMLLGKIKQSAPSRIVNVSSHAHKFAKIDFNDFKMPDTTSQIKLYCLSKLANVHFTKELAKKMQGTGVTVNALHPGVIATEITREGGYLFKRVWSAIVPMFFKSLKEGAQTSIYVCLSPEVANVTGEYFSNCKIYKLCSAAADMGIAKKVWDISEDAVKLQPNEKHF